MTDEPLMTDPPSPSPRSLTPGELAKLYRRVTGREPSPGEVEDLRRWCEEWGRGRGQSQVDHAG